MKLRKSAKKNTLPDLDDPLEAVCDDSGSEHCDYCYLSDIAEEDEECDQEDKGKGFVADNVNVGIASNAEGNGLGEGVPCSRQPRGPEAQGHGNQRPCSIGTGVNARAVGLGGSDTACKVHSVSDSESGRETAWPRAGQEAQNEEGDEDAEEEEEEDAAFNPFTLLAGDCNTSDSCCCEDENDKSRSEKRTPKLERDSETIDARREGADQVISREGDGAGQQQQRRRRRRRQRRNPRRRHADAAAAAAGATRPAEGYSNSADEELTTSPVPPMSSAQTHMLTAQGLRSGPSTAAQESRDNFYGGGGGGGGGSCRDGEGEGYSESSASGTGIEPTGCEPHENEDEEEAEAMAEAMAECWLCYGKGRVEGRRSSGGNGGSGASSSDGDDMLAPCRTCAGGLQYIHRSCFRGWLDSSWALACPNCRTLYDSAVLDALSSEPSPSVRSLLVASCPVSHDLREPFPPRAVVAFSVGETVDVVMGCGRLTAGELLRRIRLMVDDMAAVGGDGGLGLMGGDGRMVALPSFEVTGLVLEFHDEEEEDRAAQSYMDGPWVDWQDILEEEMPQLLPGDEEEGADVAAARRETRMMNSPSRPSPVPLTNLPGLRRPEFGAATAAAAVTAALRAERQRWRADLQLQQRSQQRHSGIISRGGGRGGGGGYLGAVLGARGRRR